MTKAEVLAAITDAERPSDSYRPGRTIDLNGNRVDPRDNGQLQFHQAKHVIRTCAPGNGWGKTAVVAVEVHWWASGEHPWPYEIPLHRPRQIVWIAQKFQQWELLKKVVEPWWPPSVVASWVGQPAFRYTWPNGSTLTIITSETAWTTVQGVEPDLVVGDEQIPRDLAHEMLARRRGNTTTRYVFNGTALGGLGWQYHELYKPWLEFHQRLGLDERQAMREQRHDYGEIDPVLNGLPGIWCWPAGSHSDNPTATIESWARYRATMSKFAPVEREVRLYGGYRDLNASPVFDPDSLERQRKNLRPGRRGWFLPAERPQAKAEELPFLIGGPA